MESVAAFEPLLRTALGGEPCARCDARVETYTVQGSSPNTCDAGATGHAALADYLVQFCASAGCRVVLHNAPGWETVVRGGGGVFFDTGQQLGSLGFNGPGFSRFRIFRLRIVSRVCPADSYHRESACAAIQQSRTALPRIYSFRIRFSGTSASSRHSASRRLSRSPMSVRTRARLLQENQFLLPLTIRTLIRFIFIENGLTSDYDSLASSVPAETEPRVDGSGFLHMVSLYRLRLPELYLWVPAREL